MQPCWNGGSRKLVGLVETPGFAAEAPCVVPTERAFNQNHAKRPSAIHCQVARAEPSATRTDRWACSNVRSGKVGSFEALARAAQNVPIVSVSALVLVTAVMLFCASSSAASTW